MHVIEEKLEDKTPLMVTDAEGDTLAREPRMRKVSSVPNQKKVKTCSHVIRRIPIVKCVRTRQQQHEPGVG